MTSESEWQLRAEDHVAQSTTGPFRDYILSDYEPLADPRGRLHSSSLLRYFLRVNGLTGLWPVVVRVREMLGADETVWGAKCLATSPASALDRSSVELYFYNQTRNAPGNPKSVTALAAGLSDLLRIDSRVDESLPYMMCSLELDAELLASGQSPGFRIYLAGDRRKQGYDGVSYLVRGRVLERENLYQFYRFPGERSDFRARLAQSVHAPANATQGTLTPAELDACFTYCFAQKRFSDAVYFSRIDTTQLSWFFSRYLPGPLPRVLPSEASRFSHLCWDVGTDFTIASDGLTHVTKASFYGTY